MTADHWGFVLAAYGLTAAVLLWYWRRLVKKERDLAEPGTRPPLQQNQRPGAPQS